MQMKHAVNTVSAVTQSSLHMFYWGVALDIPMGVWEGEVGWVVTGMQTGRTGL